MSYLTRLGTVSRFPVQRGAGLLLPVALLTIIPLWLVFRTLSPAYTYPSPAGKLDQPVTAQALLDVTSAPAFNDQRLFGPSDDRTRSVTVGDVNGDGALDLVVSNDGQQNVVYLNDGAGIFHTGLVNCSTPPVNVRCFGSGLDKTYSVAVGDMNGDGMLDLVTGNYSQMNVVYLNDGAGNFPNTSVYTRPFGTGSDKTLSVAVGDVNGDGAFDLAVGNGGEQNVVYLNDGAGNFPNTSVYTRPFGTGSDKTWSVALGDLDGDAALDIVVGNSLYEPNMVYLNNGEGNFYSGSVDCAVPPSNVRCLNSPFTFWSSVAVGDVSGDGALDIVVGTFQDPTVVYHNDGAGNFTLAQSLGYVYDNTYSVAVGDLNGDGALDIALANFDNSGFELWSQDVLYLNDGTGQFGTDTRDCSAMPPNVLCFGTGFDNSVSVVAGDINGDGALDLIVGNFGEQNVAYLNNGAGNFTVERYFGRDAYSVAVGDVNGDSALDLVAGTYYQEEIYLNDGAGNLSLALTLSLGTTIDGFERRLAMGDVNGDDALDIVVGNDGSQNVVYLNDGAGIFTNTSAYMRVLGTGRYKTRSVAIGDVNGDGALDIAVGNYNEQNVVYLNDGAGNFPNTSAYTRTIGTASDYTESVALGDVNGDSALDIVVGNYGEQNVVYLNDGVGNFPNSSAYIRTFGTGSDYTASVVVGDVNGDGALDIVVGNTGSQSVVYLNDGAGNFPSTSAYIRYFGTGADFTLSVLAGDVNGDGTLDLVVGNYGYSSPSAVYLNDGAGSFYAGTMSCVAPPADVRCLGGGSTNALSVAAGDMNGDGALDLVVGGYGNTAYLNGLTGFGWLANNPPRVALIRPNPLVNANFVYTNPALRTPAIPITYTLLDPEGDPVRLIRAYYSPDGGGRWLPAVAASSTLTTNLSTSLPEHYASHDTPIPIPDPGTVSSTLIVPGAQIITGIDVWVNITHTLDADLDVYLQSPSGTFVELFTDVGDSGDDFINTILDDEASTPIIAGTAPFTGRFSPEGNLANFDGEMPNGTWRLWVTDDSGADSGNILSWGIILRAGDGTHIYTWDTFASGFFGQSDNVVFRIEAYPTAFTGTVNMTGTPHYTNTAAGPFQRPYLSATTFPFRVRGTQVRVFSGTMPVSNALVYRLPAGQSVGAQPIADGAGRPFRTDRQGYLQGRGELRQGDLLVALLPITSTDSYTLYYTSATPNTVGVTATTVLSPGVQALTVTAANPLVLFNLDVSLEWDASNDPGFLTQLQQNLAKASAALYDWSNGQVALGRVNVYQDKQRWDEADVRIFASNQIRPIANRGGIVTDTTVLTHPMFIKPITATTGEIRIGPTWNRYGDPQPIGDDWPNVLAHELGHYALFLEDTYLGLENGILIPIATCTGTAMSDPYDESGSEFRYRDDRWAEQCGRTLAELPDWELVTLAYPALHSPPPMNTGPSAMPFAFTRIEIAAAPGRPQPLLDDFNIPLNDAGGALSNGRAYLRHPGERLVDLGRPLLNSMLARGARQGDELCIFAAAAFACSPLSNTVPAQLVTRTLWQPEIMLTPVNSTTLRILVNTPTGGTLTATLYPNGEAPQVESIAPTVVETITLSQPAVEVLVDITGNGPGERLITGYASGAGPGQQRGHGGPGQQRGHGGPFASGDGSVLIYPPTGLSQDIFIVLQTATSLPELPSALKPIGRAYHIRPSTVITDFTGASLSFQYLGLDVLLADISGTPQQKEASLAVHYWDGVTWTQLTTTLNTAQNFASTPLPGPGLYVLTAGRVTPEISAVAPSSGDSGQAHTLMMAGQDFLGPMAVTLRGQTGVTYPLTVSSVNTRTVTAMTPVSLPADLYDLELTNAGGLSATLDNAFALYATQPEACFFDDFASGWGKWTRTGEWDIVTADGQEAATDSPGFSYLNAGPGLTRTTTITSQRFNLAGASDPVLSFRHDYAIAIGPGQFKDWGRVEISVDDGQTWRLLREYTGGPGYPASLATTDEWSNINWRTVTINLAQASLPTSTTAARLRFNLVVDAAGSDKGWIVDDVAVTSRGCPPRVYLPLIARQTR